MESWLFYTFAALTLVCGLLVVANPFSRNPVTSAMFLVLAIGSLAGLFVMLNAFFLAAVQILVYAGAVMVLFLFVIMLLNPKEEQRRTFSVVAGGQALLAAGGLAWILLKAIDRSGGATAAKPTLEGGTSELGRALFTTQYLLPFEVVSLVLLVAMVGVVLLTKKDLK
jgi:NADH-quinone oxidoreductase subunit J